jgi:hypothetical protein
MSTIQEALMLDELDGGLNWEVYDGWVDDLITQGILEDDARQDEEEE